MKSVQILSCAMLAWIVPLGLSLTWSAEVRLIYPELEPELEGKEVDWIYGDYLMRNDQVSLVIAAPTATRDANLTVREVGASILDLSLNQVSNDQLSAFIPAGGRYQFFDPTKVRVGKDGDTVFWECTSSKSLTGDGSTATVRYRLADGDAFVQATVTIEGDNAGKINAYDGIRADRTFSFAKTNGVAYCSDEFFRQTIGFEVPDSTTAPAWKNGRPKELHYSGDHVQTSDQSIRWTVLLHPATSPMDLQNATSDDAAPTDFYRFELASDAPARKNAAFVRRGRIGLQQQKTDGRQSDVHYLQTNDQGIAWTRLIPGSYAVSVKTPGYEAASQTFQAQPEGGKVTVSQSGFSGFIADVVDGEGQPIPAKATVYSIGGEHPEFGPDSTRTFIKNCVYAVHGKMDCPLPPGRYAIHFSHGPEYNSESRTIRVESGKAEQLAIQLPRVVQTPGWVSAELHSHSSPSGDNTSDQYGRVENLLCEHLEFAPCTEHARISSYVPHLRQMGLEHLMATCSGMELTGRPLPVNHQNAFPLHHHPHTQNGGGPRTDPNPVVQIERLAMWDAGADKLVQMNHPNLHQIYGDLDTDGTPDGGFRGMFNWVDVMEVHPLETIFEDIAAQPPNVREMRIPLFQWMQLLNDGYRIPGVVNTDAHYNHHGSGWLRSWFASSTDDPAKISTAEMVKQAEAGHIVMSTGPFLSVKGMSKSSDRVAIPGDDLKASDKTVTLKVTVQCPNWLDVNRVQVFVNGRPAKELNRTRKTHPDLFGDVDAVVKFDANIDVDLDSDAHLIVATVGEGMTMQKVMGDQYGKRVPIAVSNPIFVDVDGDGFEYNHDELGLPLPRKDEPTFQTLFDGTSLDGWQHNGNWEVRGGEITRTGKGGFLSYTAEPIPDDFELKFEWRVAQGSNSGVYYRPGQYEYQILDNTKHKDGQNPRTSAASLYFCIQPSADVTRPVGQWNEARIVCKGSIIQHWLNGTKVIDFDYEDPKWSFNVDMLRKRGGDLNARGGFLKLQDHGDPVWYRNIRMRAIPANEDIGHSDVQPAVMPPDVLKAEAKKLAGIVARRQATARREKPSEKANKADAE